MNRNPKPMLIGPLSRGSRSLPHFIPNAEAFDAPSRVCNASQPAAAPGEITRLMTGTVRPGALAFKQYPSRGGC